MLIAGPSDALTGDGKRPTCARCQRSARDCHWIDTVPTATSPISPRPQTSSLVQSVDAQIEFTPTHNPEDALRDPRAAKIFRHYVNNLAGWYDLNDSRRHFEDVVPVRARHNPLLLSAILAFAAASQHRTLAEHDYLEFAEFYHFDSVRRLISVTENVNELPIGETLAAICLLRSYEIITQNVNSQSHLQGCYSILASQHIKLTTNLLSAGFWNYLREDITVALIQRRGLMIALSAEHAPQERTDDTDFANYITFLLGKIINRCLATDSPPLDLLEWQTMKADLDAWKYSLPPSFEPIQTPGLRGESHFPSLWTLRDWHVSSLHYYHTAMSILCLAEPEAQPLNALQRMGHIDGLGRKLEYHAIEVCGLAFSCDSAPVWVNAFGPIAFCGPWLKDSSMRVEMTKELERWGKMTGWPISIVADMLSPPPAS